MQYFQLLKNLLEHGHQVTCRGQVTQELLNVTLDVDKQNFWYHPIYRKREDVERYMFGELAWYLSGERSIEKILPYSKFWENIRNPDGTANSNYGDLVFYRKNSLGITSFNWAFSQLVADKETRKALVLYNDRELFFETNRDLICNQFQHFLIRDNKLHCIVALRSSDAIMGLSFNAPWWSLVQQQMRFKLLPYYPDLKLGWIKANLDSSHLYANKFELAKNMLSDGKAAFHYYALRKELPIGESYTFYADNIRNYFI